MISAAPAGRSGLLVKTPSPHIVEVLATCPGIDFAVLDCEHAPFDRRDLDVMLLAGRAAGLPLMVRVQDTQPSTLLTALDLGADGLVIPHVDSPEIARRVVALARYRNGSRGYSGGTRIAGYGTTPMARVCDDADRVPIIAQIEHPDGVASVEEILAIDDIAGILVGRADLALSMGFDNTAAPDVEQATKAMFARVAGSAKIIGVVVADHRERDRFAAMGANWFLVGTDHSYLRLGARTALDALSTAPINRP
ncbi:MAG: aldolase/citrate lyase family protein [Sphingomonas sp.]